MTSLRQEGYQVLEARDEASCREIAADYADVLDLVVLARDLAPRREDSGAPPRPSEESEPLLEELTRLQPALRMVIIEGAGEGMRGPNEDPRVVSLSKPFTVPELTETVSDILDSTSTSEGSSR